MNGTNLFSVSRKDITSLVKVGSKDGFSANIESAIVGKIAGEWQVVADSKF